MSGHLSGHGVVVVNYFSSGLVADLLAEAPWLLDDPFVVVDNSADADEWRRLGAAVHGPGVHLVDAGANLGFGAAVNLGVATLRAAPGLAHALVLNPDARLDRDDLRRLLEAARAHPRALVSPVIENADGHVWFDGGTLDERTGIASHGTPAGAASPWLTGACLLVPMDRFTALGGFDERYFLYWEDVDLSRRWLASGGELRVERAARARHLVGATQGTGRGKSSVYVEYQCRNRLLYVGAHLGPAARLRWAATAPSYARRMVRRGAASGPEELKRLRRAARRGTLAGLARLLRPGHRRSDRRGGTDD